MKNNGTTINAANALECILGQKTVSFYPVFAKAFGSVPAAVMLSQGLFWQCKAKHGKPAIIDGEEYFAKTVEEWYEETSITESAQKMARNILVKHGVFKEKLAGLPAKMHFRIDIDSVVAVINGYLLTGVSVAAKHGNKERTFARTGGGKFRQQESMKDGGIIIESNESVETLGEEKRCAASTFKIEIFEPSTVEVFQITKPDQPLNENPKKSKNFNGGGAAKNSAKPIIQIHPENEPHFAYFSNPDKAKAAWLDWIEYKHSQHREKYKEAKSEYTKLRQLFKQFNGDSLKFEEAINYSIGNLYKGIFAPKIEKQDGKFQHYDKAQQQHIKLARFVADIHSGSAFADAGKVEYITGDK